MTDPEIELHTSSADALGKATLEAEKISEAEI